MIHLIYASSAVKPFSDQELVQLLAQSHENNRGLNITGMLLYKDGNFLQVLEGEEEPVSALYETIRLDQRHHQVMLIAKRPIKERSFPLWEMGFTNIEKLNPADLTGYSNFLQTPLNAQEFFDDPGFAHRFLQVFKDLVR